MALLSPNVLLQWSGNPSCFGGSLFLPPLITWVFLLTVARASSDDCGHSLSCQGEGRKERRSLYPCPLEKSGNGEKYSPPPPWRKDRNINRCPMLGNHDPGWKRQREDGLQWTESKDHKKIILLLHQQQQGMNYSAQFYHIEQWSHAAKQPLSRNVSEESLRNTGLVRVSLFRSNYAVLHCLQLASKIRVMVKYLKGIQLSEIAAFCQKRHGIPLLSLPANLIVFSPWKEFFLNS